MPQPSPEKSKNPVTVLVTGFGPFLDKFPINSSWSIASTLPSILPATESHPVPVRIIVHHEPIRVAYNSVLDVIPPLLSNVCPKPDIVLHIGLAAGRTFYTVEEGAHRIGYDAIPDVDGHQFTNEQANKRWPNLPLVLKTGFKPEDVWQRWRKEISHLSVDVRPSEDAGNFMCGFIYYTSMAEYFKLDPYERPVIFLHVPDLPTKEKLDQGREVTCALIRAIVASKERYGAGNGAEENLNGEVVQEGRQETDANFSVT